VLGALTPLGKVANRKVRWFANVSMYTLGGLITSVSLGATVGYAGSLVLANHDSARLGAGLGITLIALLREVKLRWIPLPQVRRQTEGRWARSSSRVAPLMWGLDLGLVFTSWLTFSGAWVLAGLSFLGAQPWLGAVLFGSYWLGRALSVWTGPMLLPDARLTASFVMSVDRRYGAMQTAQAGALAWVAAVLSAMLVTSTPL
jgi:hypothetical protein